MKVSAAIIILSFCFHFTGFSQEELAKHSIRLTDGSVLMGTVLDEKDGEELTIRLSDGTVITIPDSLRLEVRKNRKQRLLLPDGRQLIKRGVYSSVGFQALTAKRSTESEEDKRWGFGAHFSSGYRFSQWVGVGLGLGIDANEYVFAPVFLEFSGFLTRGPYSTPRNPGKLAGLLKRRFPLFYHIQAGYNLPFHELISINEEWERVKGGLMIYPSIGIMFPSRSGNTFRLDIGYKFQRFKRVLVGQWPSGLEIIDKVTLNSFSMRASWMF